MTVREALLSLVGEFEIQENPQLPSLGVFYYTPTAPLRIEVRDLEATDCESIAVAIHEATHYQRYRQGLPHYRLAPHLRSHAHYAVEEHLTDVQAVHTLQRLLDRDTRLEYAVRFLKKHSQFEFERCAIAYRQEEAPEEFVRYELGEVLEGYEISPEHKQFIVDTVVRYLGTTA